MPRLSQHYLELMEIANEALKADPEAFRRLIADTFTGYERGTWDSAMDILTQAWRSGPYDMYEAYGFRLIWGLLVAGGLYYRRILVGSEPQKNSCEQENNAALAALPHPFAGFFHGGVGPAASDDGRLSWSEPIKVEGRDGTQNYGNPRRLITIVQPGDAPLEVGYTELSTTFRHLRDSRRLARWPYNCKQIILLVVTDDSWFSAPQLV